MGARSRRSARGDGRLRDWLGDGPRLTHTSRQIHHCRPCESVRSRGIVESLDRGLVAEAFEAGSIVVVYELAEEGVAIGVVGEGSTCAAALLLAADGFGDAAIEAFDQAVGLWMIRFGGSMIDAALAAKLIEGMVA